MQKSLQMIDIAQLLTERAGRHLAQAYRYSQQRLLQEESHACIEAVIMFQASMEAVINEEIESHRLLSGIRDENEELFKKFRSLSFKNKWERSFVVLGLADGTQYLYQYLQFYSNYRVPITHPQSRYVDVSHFQFHPVYEGIHNGWCAAHELLTKLEKKYSQETWEEFCKKCELPVES